MGFTEIIQSQKHKQMEHFAVMFIVLVVCFLAVVVACVVAESNQNKAISDSQAIYTTGFSTSISQVPGEVLVVNSSEDNTQAAVLMYFDDLSKLSANPNMYQGWITAIDNGGNKYQIDADVVGDYVMYGNTGYVVAYIHSSEPLPEQKLYLRMQNDRVLSGSASTTDEDSDSVDFWEVTFNPTGTDALTSEAFAGGQFDSQKYFIEQVVTFDEKRIRQQCEDDLAQLKLDMSNLQQALERVRNDGVVTDGVIPSDIIDDKVITNEDGTYDLDTSVPSPGSFVFNWRDGSVKNGYLNDIVGSSNLTSISKYLESHAAAATNTQLSDLNKITWKKSDGTVVTPGTSTSSKSSDSTASDVAKLVECMDKYRQDKQKYEVDDMLAFLELELTYRNIVQKAAVASGIIVKP